MKIRNIFAGHASIVLAENIQIVTKLFEHVDFSYAVFGEARY